MFVSQESRLHGNDMELMIPLVGSGAFATQEHGVVHHVHKDVIHADIAMCNAHVVQLSHCFLHSRNRRLLVNNALAKSIGQSSPNSGDGDGHTIDDSMLNDG